MKNTKKTKLVLNRLLIGSFCVLMLVLTFFFINYIGKLSNTRKYANAGSFDTALQAWQEAGVTDIPNVTGGPNVPSKAPDKVPTSVPAVKAEFSKEYTHLGEAEEVLAYESGIAYGLRYPVYEDAACADAVKAAAYELLSAQMKKFSGFADDECKLVIDYEDGSAGELVSVLFRIERETGGVTESEKQQWIFNKKKGRTVDAETLFTDRAYVAAAEAAEETELSGERETFSSYLLTADGAKFYYEADGSEKSVTLPYAEIHTYMAVTVNGNVVADRIRELDPEKPMIALTFDDGPHYINTPRLLEVLEKNGARSTFFVLGDRSYFTESNKETVKMIWNSGNEIASHTYSHKDLATLSLEDMIAEITKADDNIFALTGEYPTFVRPPYGSSSADVRKYANAPLITWNLDSEDWKSRDRDTIVEHVLAEAGDGKIVLMHDIHACTIDAAEILIPQLIAKGYQIVTLRELFYYKGVELENGKVYHSSYN